MADQKSHRNRIIAVIVAIILLLLLLVRCKRTEPASEQPTATPPVPAATEAAQPSAPVTAAPTTPEKLSPSTLQSPAQVVAGAVFSTAWTGPNNDGDFVTIVRKEAADRDSGAYALTKTGSPLELTAPVEAGEWELRYVTARSHTVLGRAPLDVVPADATLEAPAQVTLDTPVTVTWTGPNNVGDYITLVAKEEPDGKYGNYALTKTGPSVTITAPPKAGEGELRYMTGQGAKVLGRRPINIVAPDVSLDAPADAVVGSAVPVKWAGPANPGDYLTVVPAGTKDGLYGNYTTVNKTSPLNVMMPMEPGEAELRYMTGRGAQVLARRAIRVLAAEVSLDAPASAAAGTAVSITWTGPNNPSDYLTIVAKGSPDGQYGSYTLTNRGSPLTVSAPKTPGEAEIRYMSGQGAKVLGRRTITITE